MTDIWAKIEALSGQRLQTLAREKGFIVNEVREGKVYFTPESGTGTRRWESKEIFTLATRQEWVRTDLSPQRIAEFYKETYNLDTQNSSYIAAILKKALEP